MLERYFINPRTADLIRAGWLGSPIEQYVAWLTERKAAISTVRSHVEIAVRFGEFARGRGAQSWQELPEHVEAFVAHRLRDLKASRRSWRDQLNLRIRYRTPAEQMLRLVVPGFVGTTHPLAPLPFEKTLPSFWEYLETERGLSAETRLHGYRSYLHAFEGYLQRIGVTDFAALSPAHIDAFMKERARELSWDGMNQSGCALRVFLRYLHRQRLTRTDLSATIERRRNYRHRTVPRSIAWEQVRTVLEGIDRRTPVGKRDYAVLLLLVTYGLRAREVAAFTLDDIDWKRERLRIPRRKGGHSTTYPLSPQVGAALLEYLQKGRPDTSERHVFQSIHAPFVPMTMPSVSHRAARSLRAAGIKVPRAGSHTFRHTCVQRLVDADFSFKEIGDYVGHRSPQTTQIYGKVAVETLRQLALGDGEEVL